MHSSCKNENMSFKDPKTKGHYDSAQKIVGSLALIASSLLSHQIHLFFETESADLGFKERALVKIAIRAIIACGFIAFILQKVFKEYIQIDHIIFGIGLGIACYITENTIKLCANRPKTQPKKVAKPKPVVANHVLKIENRTLLDLEDIKKLGLEKEVVDTIEQIQKDLRKFDARFQVIALLLPSKEKRPDIRLMVVLNDKENDSFYCTTKRPIVKQSDDGSEKSGIIRSEWDFGVQTIEEGKNAPSGVAAIVASKEKMLGIAQDHLDGFMNDFYESYVKFKALLSRTGFVPFQMPTFKEESKDADVAAIKKRGREEAEARRKQEASDTKQAPRSQPTPTSAATPSLHSGFLNDRFFYKFHIWADQHGVLKHYQNKFNEASTGREKGKPITKKDTGFTCLEIKVSDYRVYYKVKGNQAYILNWGSKQAQPADIAEAEKRWNALLA